MGRWHASQMAEKKVVSRLKKPRRRYFFREWRKFRNLTQEQLAERVEMTASSISQIETAKQGFTDTTLEVFANALNCDPGDLLMRNPLDTEAPWSIWDRLKPAQRQKAIGYLQGLADTG